MRVFPRPRIAPIGVPGHQWHCFRRFCPLLRHPRLASRILGGPKENEKQGKGALPRLPTKHFYLLYAMWQILATHASCWRPAGHQEASEQSKILPRTLTLGDRTSELT